MPQIGSLILIKLAAETTLNLFSSDDQFRCLKELDVFNAAYITVSLEHSDFLYNGASMHSEFWHSPRRCLSDAGDCHSLCFAENYPK